MTFDTTTVIVIVAVLAVLILAFLVTRPRAQRIETRREEPKGYVASKERPYVKPPPSEGSGFSGEVAAAATDVAGEVLSVDAHRALSGEARGPADDLERLKGVGPKFAARLNELGITRYAQLAEMSSNELGMLDERLGPFRGRLARDRVAEQADYLARGDTDGFEAKFGALGS